MFNRRLLINSGGTPPQTHSVLEVHVDTADGSHIVSALVKITYNGQSIINGTDNKGIAVFENVPTGTEIIYNISKPEYNTASGTWIIDTDVEYETEYVILTKPLPAEDTNLWSTTAADEDGFYDTFDITIPAGVNVIYVGGGINGNESGEPCYCGMNSTSKRWFYSAGENSVGATTYVGVTPLKTYRVTVEYGAVVSGYGGSAFIRYSQRINGVTPSVLDY